MTIYKDLKTSYNQKDFVVCPGTPPVSPNGYAHFTPEIFIAYITVGATTAVTWSLDVEMTI